MIKMRLTEKRVSEMSRNDIIKIAIIGFLALILTVWRFSDTIIKKFGDEIILLSTASNIETDPNVERKLMAVIMDYIVVDIEKVDDEVLDPEFLSSRKRIYAEMQRKDGIDVVKRLQTSVPKNGKYISGHIQDFLDENSDVIPVNLFDPKETEKGVKKAKYVRISPTLHPAAKGTENTEPGKYKSVYYKLGDTFMFSHHERYE